jgi:phosphatidylglycerol:prolipoprotein diacylglycerol transferase
MLPPIEIFGRTFTGYGVAAAVGLIVCLFYVMRQAKRLFGGDGDTLLLLLIAGGGALIGSHLLFGIVTLASYGGFPTITSFNGFLRFLNDFFGGSVFFGGLIGGSAACFIALRVLKTPWYPTIDLLSTVIPLFHFFGRIGCFLTGCCFGVPSEFGFTFRHSIVEAANGVNRFPVQIIEASFNLALFYALYILFTEEKQRGKLFFIYLVCYSPARFFLEFLRGDSYRGVTEAGFSTSQIIAMATLTVGIFGLIFYRKKSIETDTNG